MGIRFQRRVRILPWLYLNFGKGGVSVSIGPRGAKITIGKRGVRGSVGIPGTGIRYETSYIGTQAASNAVDELTEAEEGVNARKLRMMLEGVN